MMDKSIIELISIFSIILTHLIEFGKIELNFSFKDKLSALVEKNEGL